MRVVRRDLRLLEPDTGEDFQVNSRQWNSVRVLMAGATLGSAVSVVISIQLLVRPPIWYGFLPLTFAILHGLATRYKWRAIKREHVFRFDAAKVVEL
jgi:hypothetical protein